jgi:hypothetical protein
MVTPASFILRINATSPGIVFWSTPPVTSFEPLALAGGKFACEVVPLVDQPDEIDDLERLVARLANTRLAREGPDHDILQQGQVRERLQFLEGAPDAEVADPVGPHGEDVLPVEQDPAAVGSRVAGDQVEQRGLAGAVGADDAEDFAFLDLEGDILVGADAAESLAQMLDL